MTGISLMRRTLICLLGAALCIFSVAVWASQDVVLLLDNSAGMRAHASAATQALTAFVNSRAPDTRIAVVTYDATATLRMPLTRISSASRQQASAVLQHLDYRSRVTSTTAGLERALDEIINHGEAGAQESIVILTDDFVKLGTAAQNEDQIRWSLQSLVPAAIYNHVRLYGLSFTSGPGYQTLQTLAQRTGGTAFQIGHTSELAGVFQRISVSLMNPVPTSIPLGSAAILPRPLAGATPAAQFNTPLTRLKAQPVRTRWLWLIALLVIIAAVFGIYAAWNMRHVRLLRKTQKSKTNLPTYGEGPHAVLYDINNPNDIKRFELADRSTLLGRVAGYDPEVQYVLIKEKTVGRCHAVIERRGHSFWITDQGSVNGTFVNGERITADRALKHGDIVAIHRHEFEFMIPEYFESEATVVGAREQLA